MNIEQEKDTGEILSYLQMIQGTIDRMATSSAIFKGFTATIVAGGVSVISFLDVNGWILFLSFIPVLCFMSLDVYYLQLERRYRFLYEQVRTNQKDLDFNLRPPQVKEILIIDDKENVRIWSCLKSPSIALFYIPIVGIRVIGLILNFGGCLK